MSPRVASALVPLLALATEGCFGTRSREGDASDAFTRYVEARREVAEASCALARRCAPERAQFACVAFDGRSDRTLDPSSDWASSFERGRLAVDEVATADCLEALAGPCATALYVTACPVLAREPVPAPCTFDWECASGACGGATCPSTCVSPWPPALDGEPCDPARGGCTNGLVCASVPETAPGPVCHAPRSAGAACVSDATCEPPLACVLGACAPVPLAEGAPCGLPRCAEGLRCLDGVCAPPPAAGEPCVDRACGPDLDCVDGTCTPFAGPGEACGGDDADCLRTYLCDAGACVQRPLPGQACDDGRRCLAGDCVDGVCDDGPRGPPACGGGEPCEATETCRHAGDDGGAVACLPRCG